MGVSSPLRGGGGTTNVLVTGFWNYRLGNGVYVGEMADDGNGHASHQWKMDTLATVPPGGNVEEVRAVYGYTDAYGKTTRVCRKRPDIWNILRPVERQFHNLGFCRIWFYGRLLRQL